MLITDFILCYNSAVKIGGKSVFSFRIFAYISVDLESSFAYSSSNQYLGSLQSEERSIGIVVLFKGIK